MAFPVPGLCWGAGGQAEIWPRRWPGASQGVDWRSVFTNVHVGTLARIVPDDRLPAALAVGGYWTRTNHVEIDIVGADRAPIAKELLFVGSIKWLEQSAFDRHDLATLYRHRAALTDEPVPVVAVSRSGVDCPGLDATYGPDDLLTA